MKLEAFDDATATKHYIPVLILKLRWSGNYYHGEMAPLLILDCFEILRHNFLVDRVIGQSVVLSSTKEDHLILRRVFRS